VSKGIVFILDALLAFAVAAILLTALSGIQQAKYDSSAKESFRNLHYLSSDVLDVLNKKGVLDSLGENWVNASGNTSSESWLNASATMSYYLERLIPPNVGYRLTVEGEVLVENNSRRPLGESIAQTYASRMLVGYGRDLPTRGAVARAFITSIASKENVAYSYFGGFIGEGDVTQKIFLPETLDTIKSVYVELNAGSDFDLLVNGLDSGCCTLSVGGGEMDANVGEFISSPGSFFNAGENTLELDFSSGDLNEQFVGGGFVRVEYNTTDYESPAALGVINHSLAGVDGIVNVYDAVSVPGQLYSMNAFLHYESNYTIYLSFGDNIVFLSNASGVEENVSLDNSVLDALLDYNLMSWTTTPVRVGSSNISILTENSTADVVLTTDVSFSMWDDRCMDGDWHTIYDRDDPLLNDTAPAEHVCTSECLRNDGLLCHYDDYWSGHPECTACRYGCWRSTGCGINDGGSCTLPCYSCVWYGGEAAAPLGHPYGGSYCYDCTNLGCQFCFNRDEDDLWCGVSCGDNVYAYYGVNGTASDPYDPAPPGQCSLYLCASSARGSCLFDRYINCDQAYVHDHTTYEADGLPSISHLTCPNKCFACNLTGVGLSKQLDMDFVTKILNYSGNRVGLVSYGDDTYDTHPLSEDNTSLINEVNSYIAGGETCVCCAIDDAVSLFSSSNASRDKFIVVMTDGVANVRCDNAAGDLDGDSQVTAKDDAIQSACDAWDNNNITVFAVGFGSDAGADTLQRIASCGNGSYYASNDSDGLTAIYDSIATDIITASYSSQIINITGDFTESTLYPDSFIRLEYTPDPASQYGELSFTLEDVGFSNVTCSKDVWINQDVGVTDFTVTSYSGPHWTDFVSAGSGGPTTAYTLRDGGYGSDYTVLGDPFKVIIPPSYFTSGANNTIKVGTGDEPTIQTGCSPDNRMVYTLSVNTLADYGDVFLYSEGCNWSIMFSDDTFISVSVPESYSGVKTCSYNSTNITYSQYDALDDAVYRLLSRLDFDDDGKVDVVLSSEDISFDGSYTSSVRSLWGPLTVKLVLWM